MMARASLYVDFAADDAAEPVAAPVAALNPEEVDQRSRAAYDKGYSSGWDDATAAATRRSEAVTLELERAIQDMGFTYHEAVGQLRIEFDRFVAALLDAFLPSLAAAGLRETLRARIDQMAGPGFQAEVELFVPPRFAPVFEPLHQDARVFPLRIVEEPSLSDAQAFAKIAQVEWSVDFTQLLSDLDTAMRDDAAVEPDVTPEGALRHG